MQRAAPPGSDRLAVCGAPSQRLVVTRFPALQDSVRAEGEGADRRHRRVHARVPRLGLAEVAAAVAIGRPAIVALLARIDCRVAAGGGRALRGLVSRACASPAGVLGARGRAAVDLGVRVSVVAALSQTGLELPVTARNGAHTDAVEVVAARVERTHRTTGAPVGVVGICIITPFALVCYSVSTS